MAVAYIKHGHRIRTDAVLFRAVGCWDKPRQWLKCPLSHSPTAPKILNDMRKIIFVRIEQINV